MAKTSLSLNQIEFIVRKLSESYKTVFKKFLTHQPTIALLLKYGFDALTKEEEEWSFSSVAAKQKLIEFKEFVKRTENIK